MLKNSKPLSGVSAKTLINKAFSLNALNRYFRFSEEDSYVRVFSKHHDNHITGGSNQNPLVSQHLTFRYDSVSLLQKCLKSSIDVDLQNVLNSYLVSSVALTATRFQGHEQGSRRGLRQGLVIEANSRPMDYYNRGPLPVTFDAFVDSFFGFYNNTEHDCASVLGGAIEPFSPKNIKIHTPKFSCGSYKGAMTKQAIRKAHTHLVRAYGKFDEFFKALAGEDVGNARGNRHHGQNENIDSFKIRMFRISGTGNETSYAASGSTQAINQQEVIRDKDGLYAIIRIPRTGNIEKARDKRGDRLYSDTKNLGYDPVYSNIFNAYADYPQLGDSFISLSGCVIVRLDEFLNKQVFQHTSQFPQWATMRHQVHGASFNDSANQTTNYYDRGGRSQQHYQTFGPLAHTIMPDFCYDDAAEAELFKYDQLEPTPSFAKQELLSLREPEDYASSQKDPNYFVKTSVTGNRHYGYNHLDDNNTSGRPKQYINKGARVLAEQTKQFYCWVVMNDLRYMSDSKLLATPSAVDASGFSEYVQSQVTDTEVLKLAEEDAYENGYYTFGFGSLMQQPIKERELLGSVSYSLSPTTKFSDAFSFYSDFPLNQEKLHTKDGQSMLLKYKLTRDGTKRGKGHIYVDHENIAYCPLSGAALKVKTYLKYSGNNSTNASWGSPPTMAKLIS